MSTKTTFLDRIESAADWLAEGFSKPIEKPADPEKPKGFVEQTLSDAHKAGEKYDIENERFVFEQTEFYD